MRHRERGVNEQPRSLTAARIQNHVNNGIGVKAREILRGCCVWRDFFFSDLSRRNFLPMKNKVPFANLLREKNFGAAMKKLLCHEINLCSSQARKMLLLLPLRKVAELNSCHALTRQAICHQYVFTYEGGKERPLQIYEGCRRHLALFLPPGNRADISRQFS